MINQKNKLFEEIQIRIDNKTYQILYGDYLYFNKRSVNALINDIIKQYNVDFQKKQIKKYQDIQSILKTSKSAISDIDSLTSLILTLDLKEGNETLGKKIKPIKIHINYRYEQYFINLEQVLYKYNNNIGFAEIIRYLIIQYTKLSRSEREAILYQENIDNIKQAIKQNNTTKMHLTSGEVIIFNPHEIINPLDDEGNYIFGEEDQNAQAIALHTIKHITILDKKQNISSASLEILKQLKNLKFNYQKLSQFASKDIIQKVIQLQKRTTNLQ